jgi:hypothetical protein
MITGLKRYNPLNNNQPQIVYHFDQKWGRFAEDYYLLRINPKKVDPVNPS